jgi:hypothetical protein
VLEFWKIGVRKKTPHLSVFWIDPEALEEGGTLIEGACDPNDR